MADRPPSDVLTARWLLGILVGVLIMGGAGWMTFVQSQIVVVQTEQKEMAVEQGNQNASIEVVKEQIRQLVEGQKRQEDAQRDMNRKLDELLRRMR